MSVESETTNSEETKETTETSETKTETSLINQEQTNEADETSSTTEVTEETVEPLTLEALALPEGLTLDESQSTQFLEILNGELSPADRANALLNLYAENAKAAQEADSKAWDDMQKTWQDEVKADPEVGGVKFHSVNINIGKLIDEHGSPELREVFNVTGAGNNVHMIKFLNNVAKQLVESNPSHGSPAGGDGQTAAQRLFPSMKG